MIVTTGSWKSSSQNVKHYPKIQSDSELSASTDSDSSIDLDFVPPTPKIQRVNPDTMDDNPVEDDNPANDDSIVSDDSSDDELGISVSSVVPRHKIMCL